MGYANINNLINSDSFRNGLIQWSERLELTVTVDKGYFTQAAHVAASRLTLCFVLAKCRKLPRCRVLRGKPPVDTTGNLYSVNIL